METRKKQIQIFHRIFKNTILEDEKFVFLEIFIDIIVNKVLAVMVGHLMRFEVGWDGGYVVTPITGEFLAFVLLSFCSLIFQHLEIFLLFD